MSPLLIPGIPLIVLVIINAGLAGWLYYYLNKQQFTLRWKGVLEDALALVVGFCAFAIFLGLMIAFEAFESSPELDVLAGLSGGLKFGMVGILGGQTVALASFTALSGQLFEKGKKSGD